MKNFREFLLEKDYSERESNLNENIPDNTRKFIMGRIMDKVEFATDKTLNDLVKMLNIKVYLDGVIKADGAVSGTNGTILNIDSTINVNKVTSQLKDILLDNEVLDNIKSVFEKNLKNKNHEIVIECFANTVPGRRGGFTLETNYKVQIIDWTSRGTIQIIVS